MKISKTILMIFRMAGLDLDIEIKKAIGGNHQQRIIDLADA